MLQVFLNDTISDCAVKRRCAVQNIINIIENARRKEIIGRHALNKALGKYLQFYIVGHLYFCLPLLSLYLYISTGFKVMGNSMLNCSASINK